MTSLEIRGMQPEAVLALIQQELGGDTTGEHMLVGDGWRVRVEPLPRVPLGRFAVAALRLNVDGERESEIAPLVRRMMMRGGG